MKSTAGEIASHIVSNGIASGTASDQFSMHVAAEPDKPDNVITVYDMPGIGVDTDQMDVYSDLIQVRTRSRSYEAGYQKHVTIRDLLKLATFSGEGRRFFGIVPEGSINSLGRDPSNRYLIVQTFRVLSQQED